MKTYSEPPLVATNYTPETLLSPGDMDYLYRHCRDYQPGKKTSQRAVELLSLLWDHGYVIHRTTNDGRIIFGQIKKSAVQQEFDRRAQLDGLDRMPIRHLQKMARENFRKMMETDND